MNNSRNPSYNTITSPSSHQEQQQGYYSINNSSITDNYMSFDPRRQYQRGVGGGNHPFNTPPSSSSRSISSSTPQQISIPNNHNNHNNNSNNEYYNNLRGGAASFQHPSAFSRPTPNPAAAANSFNNTMNYLQVYGVPKSGVGLSSSTSSRIHDMPMGSLYTSSFEDNYGRTSVGEDYYEDVEEEDSDFTGGGGGGEDNYHVVTAGGDDYYADINQNPNDNDINYYTDREENPEKTLLNERRTKETIYETKRRRSSSSGSIKKWINLLCSCCCFTTNGRKGHENETYKKDTPTWRLFFVTMCFCAMQLCWSLQISQLTPHILEMNFPKIWITLVWLCGPLSGMIVQPIIGVWSDKCKSPLGRRRPFILVGSIFMVLSLCFIVNCLDLGYLLGDSVDDTTWSVTFTIIGFWILDISLNILQGPARALVADIAIQRRQDSANAFFTFWVGLGNVIGYGSSFIDFSEYVPMYATPLCNKTCVNMKVSFYFSSIVIVISCLGTLLFAREHTLDVLKNTLFDQAKKADRLQEHDMNFKNRLKKWLCNPNPLVRLFKYVYRLPRTMKVLCIYQFFSWIGWFSFLVYITDWVGESVFRGNPDPQHPAYQLYETGVRFGSFGLAGFSVVSMIFSPFIPRISKRYGSKILLFIAQVILSLLLLMTFFVKNKYWAIVLISCFGVPYSIANTLPFTLCSTSADDFNKGTYMGILNVFIVVPQLIMSIFNPLIVHVFDGNTVATLVGGSIASLFSSVIVWFIRIPKIRKKKRKSPP